MVGVETDGEKRQKKEYTSHVFNPRPRLAMHLRQVVAKKIGHSGEPHGNLIILY